MNSSFVYENIRMETPLRGRSGGHIGAAPTVSFEQITHETVDVVWADCVWTVDVVGVDCAWPVDAVWMDCV